MVLNWKVITPWILSGILAALLLFRSEEVVTVRVPSVSGSFRAIEPQPIKVEEPKPAELVLFEDLPRADQVKAYKVATSRRTYIKTFEDSIQTVTAKAVVKGSLESLELDYETKPRRVDIPIKRRLALYVGGEVTIRPEGPAYLGKVYLVTPEVLFSGGYDFQTRAALVGAAFKLF